MGWYDGVDRHTNEVVITATISDVLAFGRPPHNGVMLSSTSIPGWTKSEDSVSQGSIG